MPSQYLPLFRRMIAALFSVSRLRLFDPAVLRFALFVGQRFFECPRLLAFSLSFKFGRRLEGECLFGPPFDQ